MNSIHNQLASDPIKTDRPVLFKAIVELEKDFYTCKNLIADQKEEIERLKFVNHSNLKTIDNNKSDYDKLVKSLDEIKKHNISIADREGVILKENTHLHSRIAFYEKEHTKFRDAVKVKLENTIRFYDNSNKKVLKYLTDIGINPEIVVKIESLFPVKLP